MRMISGDVPGYSRTGKGPVQTATIYGGGGVAPLSIALVYIK